MQRVGGAPPRGAVRSTRTETNSGGLARCIWGRGICSLERFRRVGMAERRKCEKKYPVLIFVSLSDPHKTSFSLKLEVLRISPEKISTKKNKN